MIKDLVSLQTDIVALIVGALEEISVAQEVQVPADVSTATALFGRDGILDSLALVALVIAVEQAIEDQFGVSVSLADEKALSQKNSPYRTIGSLAEYAGSLIHGAQ